MALNHVTSEHYSKYSRPVQQWTQTNASQYLGQDESSPRQFSRVLDLGCGTGQNTQFVCDLVNADEVVALDTHPNFLQYAQKHCIDERIQFHRTDLNQAEWAGCPATEGSTVEDSEKFDLIFSSFFLHWNANTKVLLQRISNLLKPGGESFHIFGIKPAEAFMHTIKQLLYHPTWADYLENFRQSPEWMAREKMVNIWGAHKDPASAFRSLLAESGHEILQCKTVPASYVTESREESKGMLQWLLPLVRFIPVDLLDKFMEDAQTLHESFARTAGIQAEDETTANREHLVWSTHIMIIHTRNPLPQDLISTSSPLNCSDFSDTLTQSTS